MGGPEGGEAAPGVRGSFWCANRHETRPASPADAGVPGPWECAFCDNPAGKDRLNPPPPRRTGPSKTHLDYVKERRTPADGEAILAEALARLHGTAPARSLAPAPQQPGGRREPPPPGPAARSPAR